MSVMMTENPISEATSTWPPVYRAAAVWRFTVTHGPLDLLGRRCIERIDKLARSDDRFREARRLHESSSWVFDGNAGPMVIALHGLAVHEGQFHWRLETLTGRR